MHPSSDAGPDRRRDVGLGDDEVISPELVLVDPDLAARARADLQWPEPTLPRPRRAAEVVHVAPPPAAAEPPAPIPEPLHFGRRLVAAATLVPALVTLALIAEFLGRSASPLGATTTNTSSPATTRHSTTPVTTTAATTRSRPSTARPSRSRSPKPAERRSVRRAHRPEGLIAQMGSTAHGSTGARGSPTSRRRKGQYCYVRWAGEGLTLVYVARVPKNPCTEGRVVGGYVTGPSWRTAAGLSIGSSLARLRRLYPSAAATGSGWWKLGTIRRGKSRRIPLHAHVTGGRVDKILVN